eukprot:COSAG02_NODE_19970_length_855_cov_0.976190_1_plen_187_part_10
MEEKWISRAAPANSMQSNSCRQSSKKAIAWTVFLQEERCTASKGQQLYGALPGDEKRRLETRAEQINNERYSQSSVVDAPHPQPMVEEGQQEKLSLDEWHQLDIREEPNWRQRIDTLNVATCARLALGVVNGEHIGEHIKRCMRYAGKVVKRKIGHQNNAERGLASDERVALKGAPGGRRDERCDSE